MGLSFLKHVKALLRFLDLSPEKREVVFYSEGPAYWTFLGPLLMELVDRHEQDVCYVSSQPDDPGLLTGHPRIHGFDIGFGGSRTSFFKNLDCKIAIMNLTDLGAFHLKRSKHEVYYINMRHALVSTHMILLAEAFDSYDCIFVAGPHQKKEIRAREAMMGLSRKDIFEFGYSRIDSMLENAGDISPAVDGPKDVLIAPSWAGTSIFETCGVEIVQAIVDAGQRAILRPHPHQLREEPALIRKYEKRFGGNPHVVFDFDGASTRWFHESHAMLTDWSGVAFEYAFACRRPVIFIDTPRKVRNKDYRKLGIEPIEVSIREYLGVVIDPAEPERVPQEVERLCSDPGDFAEKMESCHRRTVYNVGRSAQVGAEEVMRLLESRK